MLQAHAGIPADNYRVSLAVVKQWDSSQFFQWSKSCDDGGTLITQHFDLATCTINEFVEAYSLDALGPGQIGYNSCVQNAENVTPWSIYLACPAKFPL